jgi:hypothetical protein
MATRDEIVEEIVRLSAFFHSESERIVRLMRLYPPDGGRRAFEARSNADRVLAEIKRLRASIPEDFATRQEVCQRIADYLDKGYSTKEIERRLDKLGISSLMASVPGVVYYENWTATIGNPPTAVVDREVLVWPIASGFEVRYYSMTDEGRHSRLVTSKAFLDKALAVDWAKEIRRRYQ